jgi:hypothetical protein
MKTIVSERIRHNHSPQEVPFQRYGTWIIDETQIPVDMTVVATPVFSTFQNPQLSRFNSIFLQEGERKERLTKSATTEILMRMEKIRNTGPLVGGETSSPVTVHISEGSAGCRFSTRGS